MFMTLEELISQTDGTVAYSKLQDYLKNLRVQEIVGKCTKVVDDCTKARGPGDSSVEILVGLTSLIANALAQISVRRLAGNELHVHNLMQLVLAQIGEQTIKIVDHITGENVLPSDKVHIASADGPAIPRNKLN